MTVGKNLVGLFQVVIELMGRITYTHPVQEKKERTLTEDELLEAKILWKQIGKDWLQLGKIICPKSFPSGRHLSSKLREENLDLFGSKRLKDLLN